ncbi:hypothetical protein AB0I28_14020 [Phytomonospora sp. NPDC050363]|uniref:hypothetical protein n=1 Tax=Phytomonospora sp. NPDC050363 TaxID=3155642 RepID=UPI0033D63074
MPEQLSLLTRSFNLVNDLSNRPRPGESRRLPVLSLHTESGGGGDEIFEYLLAASKGFPKASLTTAEYENRSVREVIFEVYDNLTWYQPGYHALPLPRFGLVVLGIISQHDKSSPGLTREQLETDIRAALAAPGDLPGSLTRLGLSLLAQVSNVPGITDAAVDVTTVVASRSMTYARWVRAMKSAVGLTDHKGRTAETHRQVLRVLAWLVQEFLDTGGLTKPADESLHQRADNVDRALCRALMADLRDAFTRGPRRLRLLRPGRVLIHDIQPGTAPELFCRHLTEIRAERHAQDSFDPLLVIAVNTREPATGPVTLGTASYDDWARRSAGQLHREDAWHYEVAVGGLDDLDVIRLLTAAGLPRNADTADRILRRTGGKVSAVGELIDRMRAEGPGVLDDPIGEGAPS